MYIIIWSPFFGVESVPEYTVGHHSVDQIK